MRNLSESCSFLRARGKARLNSPLGTFDAITKTINIDYYNLENVAKNMDSCLSYYTYYHEQMHHYQYTASTLGLFYTYLMDVEYERISLLVDELDFTPPLLSCVEKQNIEWNEKLHPLREKLGFKNKYTEPLDYLQILLDEISDIELFLFILEGGFSLEKLEKITRNRPIRTDLICEMYYFISYYYDLTGKKLGAFYDDAIKETRNGKQISDKNNPIILMPLPNGLTFGYYAVLESHARYCELTRVLSDMGKYHKPEILVRVKKELTKQDDYQTAYNLFASMVIHIPKELTPLSVFLFCLVCDYTIHIPVPQTPGLKDSLLVMSDFNLMMPAPRFVSICCAVDRAVKADTVIKLNDLKYGKNQLLERKTLDEWNRLIYFLYDIISKDTGYPSPIRIAKAFLENDDAFNEKNMSHFPFEYDNAVFWEACKTRIEYPLFFINPELFRLIDRKKYIEISNAQGAPAMQLQKELIFYERKGQWIGQGYLLKRVLSHYLSALFFGYEQDMDLEKYFGVSMQDVENAVYNKYGKVKRFW